MKVICRNNYGYGYCLTEGKEYEALNGIERDSSPYPNLVTVIGDDGKRTVAHATRFAYADTGEQCE